MTNDAQDGADVLEKVVYGMIAAVIVAFAGLCAGLTLALLAQDQLELHSIIHSDESTEVLCENAKRVLKLVQRGNLLLCTLLLSNSLALEALPVCLQGLHAGPIVSVLIGTVATVLVGEILPQSACSRAHWALAIGAHASPIVWCLIVLEYPIVWPLSKLLDFLIGKDEVHMKQRGQLKSLVQLHGRESPLGGSLSHDETAIMTGALDLAGKEVWRAMCA